MTTASNLEKDKIDLNNFKTLTSGDVINDFKIKGQLFRKFLDTAEQKASGKRAYNTEITQDFSFKKIPSYKNSAKTTQTTLSNKLHQVNKVQTRISKYII